MIDCVTATLSRYIREGSFARSWFCKINALSQMRLFQFLFYFFVGEPKL